MLVLSPQRAQLLVIHRRFPQLASVPGIGEIRDTGESVYSALGDLSTDYQTKEATPERDADLVRVLRGTNACRRRTRTPLGFGRSQCTLSRSTREPLISEARLRP